MALKKKAAPRPAGKKPVASPVAKPPQGKPLGIGVKPFVIEKVPVDQLLLDPENPRLPSELQGASQLKMLQYIARSEAVEDLMAAIGRNGFFEGEPLVVYRHAGEEGYRVIEGNRRLASVKLLNDPSLYAKRPGLAEIAKETPPGHKPKSLPVVIVPRRDDALPYLGSRHIVGVKAWEPLPKARYMLQLFQSTDRKRLPTDRYKDVARQIGSGKRSDYVKKNLNALAVFDVIKSADFFGDEEAEETNFSFGVLYTALDAKPIAGHAGVISYDAATDMVVTDNHPIVNPKTLSKSGIRDLYDWCFRRNDDGETILGESRNIHKLAAALKSPAATRVLRETSNLDHAYERSEGVSEEALRALSRSYSDLKYVNSVIANANVDATFKDLAGKVVKQALQIERLVGSSKD
ncbi:ParB N-terminal domain-containing protein [Xanthomonas graminis]|uniref:ParB N-terminal domain-containing protein n=1 Tax=Xanthomonas graminis TaxID=3390026 RepID=UPI001F3CA3DD|nr:ParB N-terminal domain-containing protein [Xanthomonas translucens]UKE73248.1 ParB N-terminal domain-containing protein [Xanthomonas translucens pv. phleipratensis]